MSSADVVVPCYRYGLFLKECVESVLAQSVPDVRVLIIDDASPDCTADVAADLARKDSRVTLWRHTTNQGHIQTYNEGIEWASADYMMILSADDYLLPGALDRSMSLMDSHPEVGFTFGKALVFHDNEIERPTGPVTDADSRVPWRVMRGLEFIDLNGSGNMVCTPTAVVRTELQKRLGGYRAELVHSGDLEMWLRFAANASVGIVGEYQAVYRRHSRNMSLGYRAKGWLPDLVQRKAAFDCFFQTCGDALPNAPELRRRLLRSLGCEVLGFASEAFNENETEISDHLSAFALDMCPELKWSLPWLKLNCKRYVGARMWRAIGSTRRENQPRHDGSGSCAGTQCIPRSRSQY